MAASLIPGHWNSLLPKIIVHQGLVERIGAGELLSTT